MRALFVLVLFFGLLVMGAVLYTPYYRRKRLKGEKSLIGGLLNLAAYFFPVLALALEAKITGLPPLINLGRAAIFCGGFLVGTALFNIIRLARIKRKQEQIKDWLGSWDDHIPPPP